MGRKGIKLTPDVKLKYARACLEGRMSKWEAARILGINNSEVRAWVYRYMEQGELGFTDIGINNIYPSELKINAISSYLNGEDFLHKMSGGSRMKASRNTTKEERIQIVKECISNGCNYGESAIKHNVSYQQVYGWVKRFKELGEAGLEDRRGKRKVDQEPHSEIEKLQIENERLKHELYMMKMERDLLKKSRNWRGKIFIASKAVAPLRFHQVLHGDI